MRIIGMGLLLGIVLGCDWANNTSIPDPAVPLSQQPILEKWVPAASEQTTAGRFTELTRILEAEQSELKRLNKEKSDRLIKQSAEQKQRKDEQATFNEEWARLKKLPGFSEKDQKYYESVLARRAERSKTFSDTEASFIAEINSKITAQEVRVEAARAALEAAEKSNRQEVDH